MHLRQNLLGTVMKNAETEPPRWDFLLERMGQEDDGRAVELFYAHLTLGPAPERLEDFVPLLCERLPLSACTRRHLLAQDPARLLIYRSLVRTTFRRALETAMPRALARLGGEFESVFDGFLAKCATEGRCIRDIAPSFLNFVRTENFVGLPPYLWELAELETLRTVVASAPTMGARDMMIDVDLDLESTLIFSETAFVVSFKHAVHLLSEDESDRTLPKKRETHLLAYRDSNHQVRYLELSSLAALILRALMRGKSLGASVLEVCGEVGTLPSAELLEGTAKVLSDLAERGALLGVARPT